MKVVLFCGGMGMRLRESEESLPKPLVKIGYLPILWHVMKYYAHYGHKEFILCLGYRADAIKSYFLQHNDYVASDFVLSGGKKVEYLNHDTRDWRITFVDTGVNCSIGERLQAVAPHLNGDEMFLANYSDGLTDLPLPVLVDFATQHKKVATFLSVRPNVSYHFIGTDDAGTVTHVSDVRGANIRINGGFYVFRREIFQYLRRGEDLMDGAFARLIQEQQVAAYHYDGFWGAMDTFKDKSQLEEMYARGNAPWEVWKHSA